MPALGAVGLGQLLGGRLGGGRDGAGRHQAQLSLGRRSARAAEAGAERAALRAGPAATAESGDDLPPELPAARAVGGAAPRLSAIRAALLRPAARRRPAGQPQLADPRRPAHLPAAPVLLRRGEVPCRRRLRARPAARGPQRGQRQQGQGQPHLSAPRVPPPVPGRRRGPAGDSPHAPRPAETRGCRGAAVPLLGTATPLSARLKSPSLLFSGSPAASGLPNTAGNRAALFASPVAPLPPLLRHGTADPQPPRELTVRGGQLQVRGRRGGGWRQRGGCGGYQGPGAVPPLPRFPRRPSPAAAPGGTRGCPGPPAVPAPSGRDSWSSGGRAGGSRPAAVVLRAQVIASEVSKWGILGRLFSLTWKFYV